MAHFRAVVQGKAEAASRLGTKQSGIDATVSGWSGGVEVRGRRISKRTPTLNLPIDEDEFTISATSGTDGVGGAHGYIGSVVDGKFEPSEGVKIRVIEEYIRGIAEEAVNGTRAQQRAHDERLNNLIRDLHVQRSGGV